MLLFHSTRSHVPRMFCPECLTIEAVTCQGWNSNGLRPVIGEGGETYYVWGHRFECRHSSHPRPFSFLSYDPEVLNRLPELIRAQFPCLITKKYAIDKGRLPENTTPGARAKRRRSEREDGGSHARESKQGSDNER